MIEQRKVNAAHKHLAEVATGLQHVLGPDEAADVMLTVAVTLMVEQHGPKMAAHLLRKVADRVEQQSPSVGHA